MRQTWERLLFAHWRVPEEALRPVVHPDVPIDTFDGSAWLGITPFRVSGFRLRLTPPLPGVSAFLEVNVRTYATIGGKPGIYFFSLDAASRVAVRGARRTYRVPYFLADMSRELEGERVRFRSRRTRRDGPPANLDIAYEPAGETFNAEPGTLEHFLTERYCLYTGDEEGTVLRADIDHPPWPLQRAVAEIPQNSMTEQISVPLDGEPLLHYAARQEVVFWRLAPARR
jgi:uncharacterized protein YqjF (DUF2071 family)